MSSVGTKNTGPELLLRKALHRLGYRYSTHSAKLPGKPDLVFSSLKKAIFVHGCFWHGHACKRLGMPKSRAEYWLSKIDANRRRDIRNRRLLRSRGWRVITVWECEVKNPEKLSARLTRFLGS